MRNLHKTSSGLDVSNKLCKSLYEVLILALSIIFNKPLMEGVFPNAMKIAEVIPLCKSKERYHK